MNFQFKYSTGMLDFNIPEDNFYKELIPNKVVVTRSEKEELKHAFDNPINSKKLKELVAPGERIVIVTSDITRPMPSYKVLPFVIEELMEAGVKESDVSVVLALGSHRSHSEDEKRKLVGDFVYDSDINVIDSEMDRCVNLGMCKNGTPVDIFEPVANADRIICMGNIEYHYFAGYSGGAKALMPGVSSHAAIQANHSNMVKEEARTGNLDTNPVRQDIDEVPNYIKIDFIVNVVLDAKKEIIKAVTGHWKDAHREGCRFLDGLYGVEIDQPADVVVVTPGGFPKDLNLYQAQKSIDNSKHAVKEGGVIVLLASAKEGFGEHVFEEWMLNKTPDEMIEEIKRNFRLGGHKAAAIAGVLKKAKLYFVSDLEDDLVKKINFVPFGSAQEAIDAALFEQGNNAKVLLMPAGGSTLPIIND